MAEKQVVKTKSKAKKAKAPKLSVNKKLFWPKNLSTIVLALHNYLPPVSIISNKKISTQDEIAGTIKARVTTLKPTELTAFHRFRKSLTKEVFGTQEPTIHIRSDPVTSNLAALALNTNVLTCNYQTLHDQGSWASVFDEYIMVHGYVHHMPTVDAIGTDGRGIVAVVVDYDDNAAVTALADLLAYDTCQVHMFGVSERKRPITLKWHSQDAPDYQWTSTATDRTVVYMKYNVFGGSNSAGTQFTVTAAAYSWFDCFTKFRQVDA